MVVDTTHKVSVLYVMHQAEADTNGYIHTADWSSTPYAHQNMYIRLYTDS